jgi:putative membrane protein
MLKRLLAASAALLFGAAAAMAQPAKPNDAQIAHIAYTAGQIDITAAKLALQKSKNKEVRAFAQDMVRDHTAVNQKALALVKKLNVKPEDNTTSKSLFQQAQGTEASLKRNRPRQHPWPGEAV